VVEDAGKKRGMGLRRLSLRLGGVEEKLSECSVAEEICKSTV
jgi:hypothetical protein